MMVPARRSEGERMAKKKKIARKMIKLAGAVPLFQALSKRQLRQLLRVGKEVEFPAGATIVEEGLDAIDEAERANLIVASDDLPAASADHAVEARFRFAHELIRQTLISGLSLPRRPS